MAEPPDRKTLIAKMKTVGKRLGGRQVTQAEFQRRTGINIYRVLKHFDGFNELLHAAGLTTYLQNLKLDDDELLRSMGEAFRAEKGLVTRVRFAKASRYSLPTYEKRWGCWSKALRAFGKWQARHDPDFPYAEQLKTFRVPGRIPREGPAWTPLGGRQYGDPLNCRGLLHTPVNEHGVLFLFAALAEELGFAVESLTPGFPDIEAKRRVGKTWERVRIELEYQSRNFRDHGHDPTACDLIVCWEHNWPKCPIEVLELKAVLAPLSHATDPLDGNARPARGCQPAPGRPGSSAPRIGSRG
jgi:hypothetical protein